MGNVFASGGTPCVAFLTLSDSYLILHRSSYHVKEIEIYDQNHYQAYFGVCKGITNCCKAMPMTTWSPNDFAGTICSVSPLSS